MWFGVRDQRLLVVTSGSMAPAFQAGDAVVIQAIEDPSQLRVGQVATFWPPGGDRLVTHRIVDLRSLPVLTPDPVTGEMEPRLDAATGEPVLRPYIVTKGDANATVDPDATPLSRVRGVVLAVHPGWGRALGWAHSAEGRWALLAPPLAILAALETAATVTERRRRPASAAVRPAREELDAYLLD
ncbi:signal peptidase I [Actinotalea ferrariae]|nr:signal peptidase I [Actinotalea ferrariae]